MLFSFVPYGQQPSKVSGFTLIELMVAVAILGVLAALAAPAFNDTIKRYRINAVTDELTASIEVARTEARRRGRTVFLGRHSNASSDCPTPADPTADPWQCWQISIDQNNNQVLDGSEGNAINAAQIFSAAPGYKIQATPNTLSFNRWGQALNSPQLIVYAQSDGVTASVSRTVCISVGGKMITKAGARSCT